MANKYPPYVNAYGKIKDVFDAIKRASVPAKFTYDFLHTVLGLKSSSYRAMIPLLKKLGFLDADSVPTQKYKDYRDDHLSGHVLAESIKDAYEDLYQSSEYAHKLKKEDVQSKLKTLLGVSDDDQYVPYVASTFKELVGLANFESRKPQKVKINKESKERVSSTIPIENNRTVKDFDLGISYTINLNLPATTEIEVFNAIFKSLKENLLKD